MALRLEGVMILSDDGGGFPSFEAAEAFIQNDP